MYAWESKDKDGESKRPKVVLKGNPAAQEAKDSGKPAEKPEPPKETKHTNGSRESREGNPPSKRLRTRPVASRQSSRERHSTTEKRVEDAPDYSSRERKKHDAPVVSEKSSDVVTTSRLAVNLPVGKVDDASGEVVKFNVSGQHFEVAAKTIRGKPKTMLATLIDSQSQTDRTKPIFVDAAPQRFQYILDWYRYGEIHVPSGVPIALVLRDAHYFSLSDDLVINGSLHSTHRVANEGLSAQSVGRDVVSGVIARWPGFEDCLRRVLKRIRNHFQDLASASSSTANGNSAPDHVASAAEESYDFAPFQFPIYAETGWVDGRNVCNAARARVLGLKLEELGYDCEFSETDLIISLPLRLRSEAFGDSSHGDAEDWDAEAGDKGKQGS
jgi:hypothetical protein